MLQPNLLKFEPLIGRVLSSVLHWLSVTGRVRQSAYVIAERAIKTFCSVVFMPRTFLVSRSGEATRKRPYGTHTTRSTLWMVCGPPFDWRAAVWSIGIVSECAQNPTKCQSGNAVYRKAELGIPVLEWSAKTKRVS